MTLSHALAALLATIAIACTTEVGPEQPDRTVPAPSAAESHTAPVVAPARTSQSSAGQQLFRAHCASCHGSSVSPASFRTAAEMATYVRANMPPGAPGSLGEQEVFDIVAFDLEERGFDLTGTILDSSNAGSLELAR